MFFSQHCHVFWYEKEKFSENFSSFSEHRDARGADGIATVHPNGFMAGSGAAVHERVRRGTESGISDGRRPSVLLSLLMHVFSFFFGGCAFILEPQVHDVLFLSVLWKGQQSVAAPEKDATVFSAVIVMTLMKSGLWPAGAHGRKRRTPGERLLGISQCACGEETLNHSYPRGPAWRSLVLHLSRMCLSQGRAPESKSYHPGIFRFFHPSK